MHTSFHESLAPAWGLFEYWRAIGEPEARAAGLRTAELFLQHRLFRSRATGAVIRREWLALHYPTHYDILQALLVLSRMQLTGDARCRDAVTVSNAGGPGRPLAARCLLVDAARHPARHGRGRRLGTIGPQLDDHAQRAAGAQNLIRRKPKP